MTAIQDILAILEPLAGHGWAELFARHGFIIAEENLFTELAGLDRSVPGFADFTLAGMSAIEPGDPSRSLVYHALASPAVHPTADGAPAAPDAYPTLEQLDRLENAIYALKPFPQADLGGAEIAVFAYEYRSGLKTPHGQHADFVFSRTGIARIGTQAPVYDPVRRCFTNESPVGPGEIAAVPARYAAFVAERRDMTTTAVMGANRSGDERRQCLLPIRKLFDGPDCIAGVDVRLRFEQRHESVKLQRVSEHVKLAPGFDARAVPFVRGEADLMAPPQTVEASLLVSSHPAPLIRVAQQRNLVSGQDEVPHFEVPRARPIFLGVYGPNRRYTTLRVIESFFRTILDFIRSSIAGRALYGAPRNVAEFVNIRHKVEPNAPNVVTDIGATADTKKVFEDKVNAGGYWAALFEDSICAGSVTVEVAGLPDTMIRRAAYSVVTAPDFFPSADGIDLRDYRDWFNIGSPMPLCKGRLRLDPAIPHPSSGAPAFDPDETTMVAVVSAPARSAKDPRVAYVRPEGVTSYMTDAASNVFAPGWDVTYGGTRRRPFYTTVGLGSPFPEDVKLCAASNGMWAAASPDASRTFRRLDAPTAIPLLDTEIGFHPVHPAVQSNKRAPNRGWDGEYGPFLVPDDSAQTGFIVNFADIRRSDYVSNTLNGHFSMALLRHVGSEELKRRMNAYKLCAQAIEPGLTKTSDSKLWLVSAEQVADWAGGTDAFGVPAALPAAGPRADSTLRGSGYLYVFVRVLGADPTTSADPRRQLQTIRHIYVCQVSDAGIVYVSTDGGAFGPPTV